MLDIGCVPVYIPSIHQESLLSSPGPFVQGQDNILYCLSQSDHSMHQETSFPPKCLIQSQDPIGYYCPPSAYSIHRNNLFLLCGVFNRARHTLSIAGLHIDIPSMLVIACLPLTIPFPRNHLCLWRQDHNGYSCPPSYYFIHQESSLYRTTCLTGPCLCWVFLASFLVFHPTGIISVPSMTP